MRTPGAENWTDEAKATLTLLWAEGGSAREIGQMMGGKTRNAIIGMARRLHLPYRTTGGSDIRRTRTTAALDRGVHKRISARTGQPKLQPLKPGQMLWNKGTKWNALPDTTPVSLVDLEPGMCKWPIGKDRPYLFCGAHAEGVYCEHHHRISTGGQP